jgi:predicted phosphohydrolase
MFDNVTIMIQIQYCSDVHLEHHWGLDSLTEYAWKSNVFKKIIKATGAPVLCLLGDIGNPFHRSYEYFIRYCSDLFEKVFVIAGNHEYYTDDHYSIQETQDQLQKVTGMFNNVCFLEQTFEEYKGYLFIGTTLWSHIPVTSWDSTKECINDYKYIPEFKDQGPAFTNSLHATQKQWLSTVLSQCQTLDIDFNKVIVLTHHPPSMIDTSLPRYKDDPMRWSFRNDMDYFFITYPCIRLWLSGHTHVSYELKRGHATILASNQYMSQGHSPTKTITIVEG